MAKLTKNQCRSVVYHVFLVDGWLPKGTTPHTWDQVTLGAIDFDDPPLPGAPDFQKQQAAAELQTAFLRLGAQVPSALAILSQPTTTLGSLAQWCCDNQEG